MTIKLRALVKHPSRIEGDTGIAVTKVNGVVTVSLDLGALAESLVVSVSDRTTILAITPGLTDSDPDVVERIPFDRFISAVQTPTESLLTAAGNITLDDAEDADVIGIDNTSGGAIDVFVPSAATRTKKITIVDRGRNANTHNITIKPKAASGQTIMGGPTFVMDSNGMSIGLTPWADATGYY